MTILITGATGFLGTNLARRLDQKLENEKSSAKIRILHRRGSNLDGIKGLHHIETCVGDVNDPASLERAMEGVQYLYHLAGAVNLGPFDRAHMTRVNVDGTENVCQAALKQGIKKMVHVSSLAAVGVGTLENPAYEDMPYNLGEFHNPYSDTKRAGEMKVQESIQKGLNATIVNPSVMIGPWDIKLVSADVIKMADKIGIPLYFPGGMNILSVEDGAEGLILAMEKGRCGQRYLFGGENLWWKEYLTMINQVVGRKGPFLPIGRISSFVAGGLGDFFGQYLYKKYPIFHMVNSMSIKMGTKTFFLTSQKAVEELGFPQTKVKDAIQKAYDWMIDYGYLEKKI
jgi:dihydroflavonol-4-reductase